MRSELGYDHTIRVRVKRGMIVTLTRIAAAGRIAVAADAAIVVAVRNLLRRQNIALDDSDFVNQWCATH